MRKAPQRILGRHDSQYLLGVRNIGDEAADFLLAWAGVVNGRCRSGQLYDAPRQLGNGYPLAAANINRSPNPGAEGGLHQSVDYRIDPHEIDDLIAAINRKRRTRSRGSSEEGNHAIVIARPGEGLTPDQAARKVLARLGRPRA